jgi:hypothetical protein
MRLNGGVNGEPACQQFSDDGVLVSAERFHASGFIKRLDAEEIAAYVQSSTRGKAMKSTKAAVPAPKTP